MSLGRRKFVAHRSLRKVNGELEGFALFAAPLGFTAYSVPTSPATASYGPSSFGTPSGGGGMSKDFFVPFVRLDKVSPSATPDPYSSAFHQEQDQEDDRDSDDDSLIDQKQDDSTSSPESDGETPPKSKLVKRNYEDMSEDGEDELDEREKDDDFRRPSSPSYHHNRQQGPSSRSSRVAQETDENDDMEDEDDGEDTSVIRCACGNNVDFGLMIQCEMCDVWQHAGCVGIKNQAAIPSHYYCERCKPRPFHCSCGKKEANGKMLQCSVCHLFQHATCVGNPRDPHVCFRCVVPKSHHVAASSHHGASHHPTAKAESSTAAAASSSSSSSSSSSASMSAAAAAAAARGRRGRKPTPRPQNITTPSRNSQQTFRQHETRSQTAAASLDKPEKPDKAEKLDKSEKPSEKQTQQTPKQANTNNNTGAPSTRQQTNQQQQQPRHQSPTRTTQQPSSTKQSKPRPPTPPPQERTRAQTQKQEQNQHEQKQEPEEKEQELKPKKEDKDQKLEEQPLKKQKGAKVAPAPVIKEEPVNVHTPTTPTTPSTPPATPPTPPLYTLYDFVSDPSLRKSFETDHAYLVENNYEAENPQTATDEDGDGEKSESTPLSFPERMLLAKYAAEYCKAPPALRPEILQGVGVLLRVSTAGAKTHMSSMAREFANVSLLTPGGRSASQGGWTELTENIYTTPFSTQPPGIPYPYLWHEDKSEGAALEGASSAHGLVVKKAVNTGVLVAEYRGTVVPREVLHKDMITPGDSLHYLLRPPSPFILLPPSPPISTPHPSSSPSAPVVFGVDARNSGSPARFVRRSCSPNADVRVLWDKEKPRFAIFAKQHIDVHTEVTIPFDFPWRVVQRRVKCACEEKSCEVVKWFDERRDLGVNLQRMLSDNAEEEDNPDTSPPPPSSRTRTPSSRAAATPAQPTSRTRARTRAQQTSEPPSPSEPDHSPSPSPSGTPRLAASSDDEASSAPSGKRRRTSGVKQLESTLNPFTPPVDRPSREQRKLQALVKTFEKLEHREKRKKDDSTSSASSSTPVLDRRWKRKKRDHTPVLSPESDERESPSVSSPEDEPSPASSSSVTTTTVRTTTTTTSSTTTTNIKHEEEDTSTTANGNEWRRRYMRKRPSSPSHSSSSSHQQPSHPTVSPGTSPPSHPTPEITSPATPTPSTPSTDVSTPPPSDLSTSPPPSTSPSLKNNNTQSPPPPHGKKAWLQGYASSTPPTSPPPPPPPPTEAPHTKGTQEGAFDGLIDRSASLPATPKSTTTSTSNPP